MSGREEEDMRGERSDMSGREVEDMRGESIEKLSNTITLTAFLINKIPVTFQHIVKRKAYNIA